MGGGGQGASRELDCQTHSQLPPLHAERDRVQSFVLTPTLPFTTSFMIVGKLFKLCEPNFYQ